MKFCKECGALTLNPSYSKFCPACRERHDRESQRVYVRKPEVKERNRLRARRPEVREKRRLYSLKPEVKAKKRVYYHEWASRPEVAEKLREYQENYHEQVRVPRMIKHVMQRALKLGFTRKTSEAFVMDGMLLKTQLSKLDSEAVPILKKRMKELEK